MGQPTFAACALTRLAQLGMDRVSGVPGDDAFPSNDAAETVPALSRVGCANELNAADAADGCARIRRAAILFITFGGQVPADLNTGDWTSSIPSSRRATVSDDWVRLGDKVVLHTALEEVLCALVARVQPCGDEHGLLLELAPLLGSNGDALSSAAFTARLQRRLRAGDTLVIETGTCGLHLLPMLLPAGVDLEVQGLWGSIGWATPASMGVAMAKTSGRAWLVSGDGAHQLTLNELAVMGRYGVKPVIFVLNNGLYGIEDVLSNRGHGYDDLSLVRYHLLPEAFGCQGWLSEKVSTVQELEAVLERIQRHDGAAYIEVMIPNEECQPLSAATIDQFYKLKTPAFE